MYPIKPNSLEPSLLHLSASTCTALKHYRADNKLHMLKFVSLSHTGATTGEAGTDAQNQGMSNLLCIWDNNVHPSVHPSNFGVEPDCDDTLSRLQHASALFILEIKEKHKLTQVATQGIIEGVTTLMKVIWSLIHPCSYCIIILCMNINQVYMTALQKEVSKQLASNEVPESTTKELDPFFSESSPFMCPFEKVNTLYKQLSFYRKNFNFIVRMYCKALALASP